MKKLLLLFILSIGISYSQNVCPSAFGPNLSSGNNVKWKLELINPNTSAWEQVKFSSNINTSNSSIMSNYSSYRSSVGEIRARYKKYTKSISTGFKWEQSPPVPGNFFQNTYFSNYVNILIDEFCNGEEYRFDFIGGMIDKNIPYSSNQYSFTNSGVQVYTVGFVDEKVNITPSPFYQLEFSYPRGGCTLKATKNVMVLDRPSINWTTGLPDSIVQGQILRVDNLLSYSADSINGASSGLFKNGSQLELNTNFTDTGWITVDVKASGGFCDSTISDSIFVKYNPGQPTRPSIMFDTNNISGLYTAFYHYSTVYWMACDNKTYNLRVTNPKKNQPNALDNLDYIWFVQTNTGLDTIGYDTLISYKIPNNGIDDIIKIYCLAYNYLGVSSSNEIELQTNTKPNFNINDSICYNDSITTITNRYDPKYWVYPTLMDSTKMDSSLNRINTVHGIDFMNDTIFNYLVSGQKINNVSVESIISNPYKNRLDSVDLFIVFGSQNIKFQNYCDCEWYDTVTYIQKPKPSWIFNYSFPSDSIVLHGDLMRFTNTSVYSDYYYWDFHDGNWSSQVDGANYVYNHGGHSVTLTAYDTLGCKSDTFTLNAYYSENPWGIEENKSINNLSVYPNPITTNFSLKMSSEIQDKANLIITSLNGSIVFKKTIQVIEGENIYSIELNELSSSLYKVSVISDNINVGLNIVKR